MAQKLKLWKTLLLAMLGGLVTAFLGVFQFGKSSEAQELKGPAQDVVRHLMDRHWFAVPVPNDTDRDLIADAEETALGLDPLDPDQNDSRMIDGPELAAMFENVIDRLPVWNPGGSPPKKIVKMDNFQYGTELCDVCGVEVNMGFLTIYNPWKDISIDIPYIGMHYLEHGSFGHDGSIHLGRIDVELLNEVLEDYHLLPVENDTDGDLLKDEEEQGIGSDPLHPDENGNFVADGVDRASTMKMKIDLLPYGPLANDVYKVDHKVWGEENCEICGESVNMGYLEVTDPTSGLSVLIPYVALHYMEHGSFSFDGTINEGRVDVKDLYKILKNAG